MELSIYLIYRLHKGMLQPPCTCIGQSGDLSLLQKTRCRKEGMKVWGYEGKKEKKIRLSGKLNMNGSKGWAKNYKINTGYHPRVHHGGITAIPAFISLLSVPMAATVFSEQLRMGGWIYPPLGKSQMRNGINRLKFAQNFFAIHL